VPSAPLRYCSHQGCPEKVTQGRCKAHQSEQRVQEQRYTKGNYGRPHRRRIAAFRSLYPERIWCEHCLAEGVDTLVEEYDHIIPHRGDITLRDDVSNLQPLCKRHHSIKTAGECLTGSNTGGT
jgi:5-methylcytosine-specific restriction protein A